MIIIKKRGKIQTKQVEKRGNRMPDAVKKYIETKDIREVDKFHLDIVELYKEDFSQYEHEDKKLRLKPIYEIVPAELNKQNKKFDFTMLDKELKFDRYENSFLWLKDAGVVIPVYNADSPVIPLLKYYFNFIIVKINYIILGANDIIECEVI